MDLYEDDEIDTEEEFGPESDSTDDNDEKDDKDLPDKESESSGETWE